LDTCELYNAESETWEEILPMATKRFGCGVTYIEKSNKVLVVGGYTGGEWTTTCELYNVATNSWSFVAVMPTAVQFCMATTLGDDYVFVRGQTADNTAVLQSYCVSENRWMILPTSSQETVGASFVSIAQRLLVLGGASGDDMEATTSCQSWKVDLYQLWDKMQQQEGTSTINSSTQAEEVEELEETERTDDEDSHHPLYAFSSNQSTSSTHSPASRTSSKSGISKNKKNRRKAQNLQILDNYGAQVVYTGYISSDTGRPSGKGKMTWQLTGDLYEGRFEHGARQGRGTMKYSNGDLFEGLFSDDQREGRGMYTYGDGRKYDGMYVDDVAEDPNGSMSWKDGTTYVGQFARSKRTGKGTITFPSKVRYQGDFLNGKYHGRGTCKFSDGSVYQGQWKHGKAHGQGTLTNQEGEVVHAGKWVNDGPVF
jgi:hypothetical protein